MESDSNVAGIWSIKSTKHSGSRARSSRDRELGSTVTKAYGNNSTEIVFVGRIFN